MWSIVVGCHLFIGVVLVPPLIRLLLLSPPSSICLQVAIPLVLTYIHLMVDKKFILSSFLFLALALELPFNQRNHFSSSVHRPSFFTVQPLCLKKENIPLITKNYHRHSHLPSNHFVFSPTSFNYAATRCWKMTKSLSYPFIESPPLFLFSSHMM